MESIIYPDNDPRNKMGLPVKTPSGESTEKLLSHKVKIQTKDQLDVPQVSTLITDETAAFAEMEVANEQQENYLNLDWVILEENKESESSPEKIFNEQFKTAESEVSHFETSDVDLIKSKSDKIILIQKNIEDKFSALENILRDEGQFFDENLFQETIEDLKNCEGLELLPEIREKINIFCSESLQLLKKTKDILSSKEKFFYEADVLFAKQNFYFEFVSKAIALEKSFPWDQSNKKFQTQKIHDFIQNFIIEESEYIEKNKLTGVTVERIIEEYKKFSRGNPTPMKNLIIRLFVAYNKERPKNANTLPQIVFQNIFGVDEPLKKPDQSEKLNEIKILISEFLKDKDSDFKNIFDELKKLNPNFNSLIARYPIQKLEEVGKAIQASRLFDYLRSQVAALPRYIDPYRLIKGSGTNTRVEQYFIDWHLHQAILREAISDPNISPVTKKQLEQQLLNAYFKVAQTIGRGLHEWDQDWQLSPFFLGGDLVYHRSTPTSLPGVVYIEFCKDINKQYHTSFDLSDVYVVNHPFLKEVFVREMPYYVQLAVNAETEVDPLLDKLLEDAALGKFPTHPVFIDFSRPDNDISMIKKNSLIFNERFLEKLKTLPKDKREEYTEKLFSKICCSAFTKHQEENILLILHDKTKYQQFNIAEILSHTGSIISPAHATNALLKIISSDDILKMRELNIAELATGKIDVQAKTEPLSGEISVKEFRRFLETTKFGQLGDSEIKVPFISGDSFEAQWVLREVSPYLAVVPKATLLSLQGLLNEKKVIKLLEDTSKEGAPIKKILEFSFFRIANAMREAVLRQDNPFVVRNQIDLIHQEIQDILAIAEPYSDTDFKTATIQAFQKDNPQILKALGNPKAYTRPSAMAAFSSIISGVEAEKKDNHLNIVVLKDSYYETSGALEKAKTHKLTTLDGDRFKENPIEALSTLSNVPIDLFLCEFHHNISATRQSYRPENILEQVKAIFAQNLAAEKLTVAIDTTIDLENSEEMRALLLDPKIQELITRGKLNIIFFRSAQKFDMLGLDNYYGGVVVNFNEGSKFSQFNQRMGEKRIELKGIDYQGLTHLKKYGGSIIDDYRQAIMTNTRNLYELLPSELIYDPRKNLRPIQISKNEDFRLVFIDIKFVNCEESATVFDQALEKYALRHNLPFTKRASFGFANMNYTRINSEHGMKRRLNPGLEDSKTIQLYANFFNKVSQCMIECEQDPEIKILDQQIKALSYYLQGIKPGDSIAMQIKELQDLRACKRNVIMSPFLQSRNVTL